jgi:hypothetical protein
MPDSDALDQAMQMDREYFEQHPDKSDYYRLAVPGEDFGYFPPKTLVHVVNFCEGTRQRSFYLPPQEIWADLEHESNKNEKTSETC